MNDDALIPTVQRVEVLLRNGLPTTDDAAANVIASAHDEVERLLERIGAADLPEWWFE